MNEGFALKGVTMNTLMIMVFVCTFLSGVTAGAWLNGLTTRERRAGPSRR